MLKSLGKPSAAKPGRLSLSVPEPRFGLRLITASALRHQRPGIGHSKARIDVDRLLRSNDGFIIFVQIDFRDGNRLPA